MIPDWYEHAKGWNETNDNYSSWLQIRVQWIDTTTGGACTTDTTSCRPLSIDTGSRAPQPCVHLVLDGPTRCHGRQRGPRSDGTGIVREQGACTHPTPRSKNSMPSPTLSFLPERCAPGRMVHDGEGISEGWQLRAHLLGLGSWDENVRNYLKMDQLGNLRSALCVDPRRQRPGLPDHR